MIVFLNVIFGSYAYFTGDPDHEALHTAVVEVDLHSDILMLEINLVPKQTQMRKNTQNV